jgi:hypothetical protein
MKVRQVWVVVLAVAMFAACNSRREAAVSGTYGSGTLSGEVYLTGTTNSSPAGVQVGVRGTGMTTTLTEDGQFAFASVPDGAELDFTRAEDGIEASLRVEAGSSFVAVELSKVTATARKSRRRGVSSTKIQEFEGLIRTAAADSIVMFTSKKAEVTIALTPETVIRKGNTTLTAADLAADMRVHVKATQQGELYTAVLVIVQNDGTGDGEGAPPAVTEYEGTVVSGGETELVVFTSHRQEVTFVVNADTVIRKGNTAVAAADIQPGWRVHVKATTSEDGTTNTATLIIVQDDRGEEVEISGTVASVGASSFVVTTATGDVTVEVSPATQIRKSGKRIALSDVAVGDVVEVEGNRVNETTIEAKKVTVEG